MTAAKAPIQPLLYSKKSVMSFTICFIPREIPLCRSKALSRRHLSSQIKCLYTANKPMSDIFNKNNTVYILYKTKNALGKIPKAFSILFKYHNLKLEALSISEILPSSLIFPQFIKYFFIVIS